MDPLARALQKSVSALKPEVNLLQPVRDCPVEPCGTVSPNQDGSSSWIARMWEMELASWR
jgi:hypothetical protein